MNEEILHLGYLTLNLNREKERKKLGEQEIKEKIYSMHVTGEIEIEIADAPTPTYNSSGLLKSAPKIRSDEIPTWAKKIEREIIKKTHPDMLTDRNPEEIEEKRKMFMKAKDSIVNKSFVDLLPIALSLGIDFKKFSSEFKEDIDKKIKSLQLEIKEIKSNIAWLWKDLNEPQRIEAIDLILKRSGITRSKEDIKKAVNRRPTRKTGTRPKRTRRLS